MLGPDDFERFFMEMWRYSDGRAPSPFDWQRRLASRVLDEDRWPEAIALPAASGKTACMDIAVFALAAQASRLKQPSAVTAPRRIFFVVDRRVIVDQAYKRACHIQNMLCSAKDGILREVADHLRDVAHGSYGGDKMPLMVHSLRGGMYRSDAWAVDPLQPTIVTSTVDQVGSRLLFRGYGHRNGTWPVYAGLIANDSIILLDEAHCAQPFMQTMRAVGRFQNWATEPLGRCFHTTVMSATPPPNLDKFTDTSGEGRDPRHILGMRQLAHKPATLEVVTVKGQDTSERMAQAMKDAALRLVNDGLHAVVVFANRVATVRNIYQLLKPHIDTILLTGRMRPLDKDTVVDKLLYLGLHSNESAKRILSRPVVVVATQTLEVGADLDFDGMVTECASLDSLQQRFGRLNRTGRGINCRAIILVRSDQTDPDKSEADPVYGSALAKTWKWLNGQKDRNGEVDFGIAHMDIPRGVEGLNAPSPDAPVMLPMHIDSWVQTWPVPDLSPDVSLFLHGPRRWEPEVRVCWRADLDLRNRKEESLEVLRLCSPTSSETAPVPIWVFQKWLAREVNTDGGADVEGNYERSVEDHADRGRKVVRWEKRMNPEKNIVSDPKKIQPHDVIVIPTSIDGDLEHLADLPEGMAGAALDMGDQSYRRARAKPMLRLHRKLVDVWPDTTSKEMALELLSNMHRTYQEDSLADELYDLLVSLAKEDGMLQDTARALLREYNRPKAIRNAYHVIGSGHLLIVGRRRQDRMQDGEAFSDADDADSSGLSHRNGQPVRLRPHLEAVGNVARRYASGCSLPTPLVEAVACAGHLHDIGKVDPRFQAMLLGGLWDGQEYYAKSARYPKTRRARKIARERVGYPEGRPHPLLSVRMAESVPEMLPDDTEMRDLVLHLIGSHHGQCRPFAPVIHDQQPVHVEFEVGDYHTEWDGPLDLGRLDSGVSDRYWLLVKRYGWWGLAWLECMIRLADWRRSEWEERNEGR